MKNSAFVHEEFVTTYFQEQWLISHSKNRTDHSQYRQNSTWNYTKSVPFVQSDNPQTYHEWFVSRHFEKEQLA